ncbi:probable protein S-acyltransferase 7 [Cynara cardunculus var. scolymus]|uniref:S-acyltransferase n=1 Tax=Cynara cardunculus var. scolymus TaxID=59895 RepID=A0A103YBQ8_CYNCS|nr:probable protein S-acyltransferase 7 [Cynara cardunculus var. scolymus]KVI06160.1 Zinc finger, DHHC-type, palmitoyltransferase [Cynara cardunculus var. scolymus]
MYGVHPAKDSDEAVGNGTTEVIRTYQTWKGSNIFFLGGRVIFGPDVRSVFLSIFLIVAPVAVFCVFVARKLLDEFAHHLGILVMVIAIVFTSYVIILLLMTSGRDPGIIPRNTHPPEPEIMDQSLEIGSSQTPQLRLPRIKEVMVNGMTVKVKYCDTCMLYRPPRCSHCSICDNCVERFDHHCPWVGQCIGRRNYRFFFMFVSSATLLCIYVFAFCWVYVIKIKDSEEISIWAALIKTPASIVLIIYTFICVWFVGGLTVFHLYLISTNQSTYENFRYRYDRTENPYNRGVVENFKEVFWSSIPPSKNKFRAVVQREPETLPRAAGGGGFMNSNVEKTPSDIEMGNRKPTGNNGDEMSGGNNRRSSWGRRSGSWELPSDIASLASGLGDSNRIIGGSSGSLGGQNRQ